MKCKARAISKDGVITTPEAQGHSHFADLESITREGVERSVIKEISANSTNRHVISVIKVPKILCSQYTSQPTMFSVHNELSTNCFQYTLFSVHYVLSTQCSQYKLFSVHNVLSIQCSQYTMYVHSILCSQYTMFSEHNVLSTLYTL